jgi:hypothetical protein
MDKPIITQGRACQNFQSDNSQLKRTSILSPHPSSGKPSLSLTFFTFERACPPYHPPIAISLTIDTLGRRALRFKVQARKVAAYIERIYTWLLGNILLLHTTDGRKEHRTEASSLPAL